MTAYGTLMVRVHKQLDGDILRHAVPVRIRRTDRGPLAAGGKVRTVAAPATLSDEWAVEQLPVGSYEFEATLPSGEVLTSEAQLGEGDQVPVVLQGLHSANEWRSWAHFSGLRDASQTAMAARGADSLATPLPPPDYAVSLGSLARDTGNRETFAADEWNSWYSFLVRRWEARTASQPTDVKLELREPDPDLRVRSIRGGPGEPVLLSVEGRQHYFPPEEIGRQRNFLAISSARGTRLISLPWPWNRGEFTTQGSKEFLHVLVSETDRELLCDATIRDEHLGGILAYLNAGRVGLAGELLKLAHGALFAKYDNPLGAAAGGYVLLSTAESKQLDGWPEWLDNLSRSFPSLPDGTILRAKWLLDRGKSADTDKARDLLVTAYERGIPFFTAGVVWLLEGLGRVAQGNPEVEILLRTVRGVARSMDLSRGISSFNLQALEEQGEGERPAEKSAPARFEGEFGEVRLMSETA